MTKWRNKAPLGKETSTQMEKRHNGLGGECQVTDYHVKSECGDPQIREIRGATAKPACLLTELGANPERQAGKNNLTLRKECSRI